MSAKSSPKVVKVDLQSSTAPKKSRRKIQGPKKNYLSPQKTYKKKIGFCQTDSQQKLKQQSVPQLQQSGLIESEVQAYQPNEFSFSEQNHNNLKRIRGEGYEILFTQKPSSFNKDCHKKINFMHVGMGIKIFELCNKNYEDQKIVLEDLQVLSTNLAKQLKAIYGGRNEQLRMKKEAQIKQGLKLVFYRKREIEISEMLFYLLDCQVADQIVSLFIDIFPEEIKEI